MTLLRVNQLTKNFGGLCAVSNVSMNIEEGELIGLIGPNGAGKTTFFNLLTGVYEPSDGTIELNINGKMTSIGGLKPYRITQMGLARTFQNIRLFKSMSALDNVKVAMHKDIHYGSIAAILRLPSYYKEEERVQKEAEELLKVVGLYEKRNERAENLPYGEQRRLEIARALAAKPRILFLDEPAAGMNPNETGELMDTIQFVCKNFDMTVLLIEHDMKLVSGICQKLTVLNFGQVLAQGKTSDVLNDPKVIKAYLGE